MAIVFAVRGTSFDARYSSGGKEGMNIGGGMTVTADAGALSGSLFVAASNNNQKAITWTARRNTPNGRAISILRRVKIGYTGSPAAARPVLPFLSTASGRLARIEISHNTAGNVVCTASNEAGTTILNATSFGAWSPTSGTYYDVVMTWDGTTTANSFSIYIDGTLLGQATPTAAYSASWANTWFSEIATGGGVGSINDNATGIDEIVIWDTVIDPTSVGLVSGTGSLNGASRTSLVDVSSFDGASWTALTADKIKTGESQTQAGVAVNGTYTGSDRWSDPGVAHVRLSTAYKADSTTNNRTGTVRVPPVDKVEIDYVYDASDSLTGTLEPSLTAAEIADAVWDEARALTQSKFLALKD